MTEYDYLFWIFFVRNQQTIDNTEIISYSWVTFWYSSETQNVLVVYLCIYFLVQPKETFKTLSDVGFRTRALSGRGLCGHVAGSLLISRTHNRPGSARLAQPINQSRCVPLPAYTRLKVHAFSNRFFAARRTFKWSRKKTMEGMEAQFVLWGVGVAPACCSLLSRVPAALLRAPVAGTPGA